VTRSYGTGSVTPRGDGTWRIRISLGNDPITGRRRWHTETFRGTKTAAQRRAAALNAQHGGRRHAPHQITLAAMIEQRTATTDLAPGTRALYRYLTNLIPERLAATPIDRIQPDTLETLYRHVAATSGPTRAKGLHSLLSATFRQAVRYGWLDTAPTARVRVPRIPRRQDTTPELDDVNRLLDYTRRHEPNLYLWLRLAVVTGARRGEILAVRWQDVNLDAGRVTISGSIDKMAGGERRTTKTDETRTIHLDAGTVDLLRAARAKATEFGMAMGRRPPEGVYVFATRTGRPWHPDVASRRFSRIRARAGLEHVRLHDLRHAHASQLLAAGIDVAAVSARLGHARTSMTLDVYSSPTAGVDRRAAEVIAAAID
jgi:integrase